ncbi:flavin reductase family protein [Streptomyces sioyaensis]
MPDYALPDHARTPKGTDMVTSENHPARSSTALSATNVAATTVAADDILRRTLRRHAAGVTVITVPGPAGFTATSFTSVSLGPPLVSFCLGLGASTAPAVREADRFAVHLLGTQNAEVARQFARSGADRFQGTAWTAYEGGLPILDGRTRLAHRSGDAASARRRPPAGRRRGRDRRVASGGDGVGASRRGVRRGPSTAPTTDPSRFMTSTTITTAVTTVTTR